MTAPTLRVAAGQIRDLTDEKLRFAVQLGVSGVQINTPLLPGDSYWEEDVLRAQVLKCQEYGLTLESLENVPAHFYNKAMLGLDGRDEQIENYQRTIRNMAEAEIPVLGFHWMPNSVWRTERLAPTRGGAGATQFDMTLVASLTAIEGTRASAPSTPEWRDGMPMYDVESEFLNDEQLWQSYNDFISALVP